MGNEAMSIDLNEALKRYAEIIKRSSEKYDTQYFVDFTTYKKVEELAAKYPSKSVGELIVMARIGGRYE